MTETASFTTWWRSNYIFVTVFAFHELTAGVAAALFWISLTCSQLSLCFCYVGVSREHLLTSFLFSKYEGVATSVKGVVNRMKKKETEENERAWAEEDKKKKRIRTANPSRSSECAGKQPGDWRQSVLQLCGSYLFRGGSEQIGANSTARVCFMSQHAAEAWASHHTLLPGLHSNLFYVGRQTFPQSPSWVMCVCVCGCRSWNPLYVIPV